MQRRTAGRRSHVLDEAAFISTPPPQLRRRTNTDNATSPVPLTPYTGNTYHGYSSSSVGAQQGYFSLNERTGSVDGIVVKADYVRQLQRVGKQLMDGFEDASRVDRSLAAIQRDAELRSLVIKSTAVNLIALLSIVIFDFLLLPSLRHNHASAFAAARTKRVRLAFDILWKYPVFGFCFWVNTFWSRAISKRALSMQPSSSRGSSGALPETDSLDLSDRVIALLPRFLIIGTHTTVGLILSQVPLIGAPVSLMITCLVDAYYCFEPSFKTRGYSLYAIGRYFVDGRLAYFLGFGVVPALMCAFVPFLASVIIFAIIYPICVIQALQARSRFVDVAASVEDGLDSPSIEASTPTRARRPNARSVYKRFLQAFFSVVMLSIKIGGVAGQSYSEELTLKPLPNGKMSLLFDFRIEAPSASEHFRLAPPSLLLPLQHNNVSEMHLSLVTGRWKADQWGQPQHSEVAGTGAELRAWFRDENPEDHWKTMTNSLAGLFCSSLGQIDASITASPEDIFPDANVEGLSFRHAQLPAENLCTENLTPFLKLLPCKGLSGLSALMKPYVLLAHEWHAMGVDYVDHAGATTLGLRWEAVVDLTKGKVEDAKDLDFSISSIFDRVLPSACPAADSSRIVISPSPGTKVIILDDAGAVHPDGGLNWTLDRSFTGKDIKLRTLGHVRPALNEAIAVSRTLVGSTHSNSGFSTNIRNNLDSVRQVVYTEELPWWIRLWVSEIEINIPGHSRDEILRTMTLHPSIPRTRPTVLQLQLDIPPQSQVEIRIPFSKEYIRYTEHLPDASRGWELPPAIIFLADQAYSIAMDTDLAGSSGGHRRRRLRLYTSKLLVDLPTPDFSMPYNVIIMTSTLIALFFGSIVNLGVRRWGIIAIEKQPKGQTDH